MVFLVNEKNIIFLKKNFYLLNKNISQEWNEKFLDLKAMLQVYGLKVYGF